MVVVPVDEVSTGNVDDGDGGRDDEYDKEEDTAIMFKRVQIFISGWA